MQQIILTLLLIFLLPLNVSALQVPKPTGYVNDLAQMLSTGTEQKIEKFLRNFESSDSTQLMVLTINSLEGETIEDYSLTVAENWGIGQKGKDNGALLLIAKKIVKSALK